MRLALAFNLLVAIFLLSGLYRLTSRSEYRLQPDALPAKIKSLIGERYPGAQIVRAEHWLIPDPDMYLVKLDYRNREVVLKIQKPARIVEVRRSLPPRELPEPLAAQLSRFPGLDNIHRVLKITRAGEPVIFRIDFFDPEKQRLSRMKLTLPESNPLSGLNFPVQTEP